MNPCKLFFFAAMMSAALSTTAAAQVYQFREIPAGVSLFANTVVYSVTDKGEFLIDEDYLTGPGTAFIYNGHTTSTVPANAGDAFFALNTPGYLLGSGNRGTFLQDSKGNQTFVTSTSSVSFSVYNMNDLNVLVGGGYSSTLGYCAVSWKAGTVTPYVYPGASNNLTYAFVLKKSGKTSFITVPNYDSVYGAMINNAGLVVGFVYNSDSSYGQLGFYKTNSGKVITFDYADHAPVALPGPKGPLILQQSTKNTEALGVNNLGVMCGTFTGTYIDDATGYTVYIPFLGQPGG